MDYSCHSNTKEVEVKECKDEHKPEEKAYVEPTGNNNKMVFKMPLIIDRNKLLKHNVLDKEQPLNMTKQNLDEAEKESNDSMEVKENKKTELPYVEPSWGGKPKESYAFEVLKNGIIVSTVDVSDRSYTVFGRLTSSDITLEHPSVSRYHAVLQFRLESSEENPKGFYIYDLESTHGTFLNKERLRPRTYYRMHVGHMLKFGGSSRMFILQGPSEDEENESEYTVTEIKEMRRQQEEKLKMLEEKEKCKEEESHESEGIDWGLGEDAEEDASTENPFALSTPNEDLYLDDPKKTLRGWFEREGYDLEYDVEEKGFGQFTCKIQLPIDTPNGEYVYAEASVRGKKKEAVAACALEACRILDRYGLLRQAQHESRKRKRKNWEENDFYDSDEDTFFDRTGTIEKKRDIRKRMYSKEQTVETYETLVQKLQEVDKEIEEISQKLQTSKLAEKNLVAQNSEDDLDSYMSSIQSGLIDKKMQSKLQIQLNQLQQEQSRLQKLVDIARPVNLPALEKQIPVSTNEKSMSDKKTHLPMTGAMKGHSSKKTQKMQQTTQVPTQIKGMSNKDEEEEEEEEDDDDYDAIEANPAKASSNIEEMQTDTKEIVDTNAESSKSVLEQKEESKKVEKELLNNKQKAPIKGPLWPPPENLCVRQSKKEKEESKKNSKKNEKDGSSYEDAASKYAMWLPPTDQSGDGRTHLNEKFGY
ncbi:kanadaptin-like [Centruroides sculpturatus]|uniref:kanadaptin-like n=1 Tax=Centruroides sculpturatus TaxID=218467 RepID=UPI000C6D1F5F|nr:kanadaptin-like [Centruroides sculpturatus]